MADTQSFADATCCRCCAALQFGSDYIEASRYYVCHDTYKPVCVECANDGICGCGAPIVRKGR